MRRAAFQLQKSIPLFAGGGVSPSALAVTMAFQTEQPVFAVWAAMESVLLGVRIRAASYAPSTTLPDKSAFIARELFGAASIGFGSVALITGHSEIGAGLGWMTAAAFAGETCVRTISSQRVVAGMLVIGAGPAIVACAASGDEFLQVAAALTTLFVGRMALAGHRFNALLVDSLRAERESDHRSRHDRLTGLLNRAGLERETEFLRNDDATADLTLFFIDLDGFKAVNDTHGHRIGDELLRKVAEYLLELVGHSDIIARLGGDEFVVVTTLDLVEPAEFGSALLNELARVTRIDSITLAVTASIGVAQTSARTCNLDDLMATADMRLYAAKRAGGNRCFTSDSAEPTVPS